MTERERPQRSTKARSTGTAREIAARTSRASTRPAAAKKATVVKRASAKKTPAKKAPAKNTATERASAKKTPAKRTANRRATAASAGIMEEQVAASYTGPPRVRIPLRDPHPARADRAQRRGETHPDFGLANEALVEMWYLMLLSRAVAERWFSLNRQGRAPFVITGQGQEAAQVGTAAALVPGKDWVMPYYRDIGVALTLGMTVDELMLNVFAKASDPSSGGRQMPAHWSSKELRIPSQSSPVGTQIPIAAGLAWASQLRGEDAVAVAYIGEGSTSQGDFHEGLNFAAVKWLPLIVVVENNGYAISEVQANAMRVRDAADRAKAYGLPGIVVDGNDLLLVYRTMQQAVQEARMGHGPTLIEAKTYRTVPHSSDDDDRRYRTREELEMWMRRDPIDRFREHLLTSGILTEAHAAQLVEEAKEEVRAAALRAEAEPDPNPTTLLDHLFAAPMEGERA